MNHNFRYFTYTHILHYELKNDFFFFKSPANCSCKRYALARDKTVLDTTKNGHKLLVLKRERGANNEFFLHITLKEQYNSQTENEADLWHF